jgi:16S rRNA (guanine966-N2)-methyltransferase
MDPPYKEKNLSKLLIKVNKAKILSQEGIIIIHRHKKENDTFPKNFKIFEEKIYGISKVIFGYF